MKKIAIIILAIILILIAWLYFSKHVRNFPDLKRTAFELSHSRDKVAEQEAFDIAYNAYTYSFPRVKGMLLQNQAIHPKYRNYAPINKFFINSELAKPGFTDFTPNCDTYYGLAWLDVSQGPILFNIPEIPDRYYTIEATDAGLNVINNICSRLNNKPGLYAYCKHDWQGELPPNTTRIDCSTNQVFLQARTLALKPGDKADQKRVYDVMSKYSLEPLNKEAKYLSISPDSKMVNPLNTNPDLLNLNYYQLVNEALTANPPLETEKAFVAQFATLNIGPGLKFDESKLTDAQRDGMKDGQMAAFRRLYDELKFGGERIGGFNFRYDLGDYSGGFNYRLSSGLAYYAYGGNVKEEAMYVSTLVDSKNEVLQGKNVYKIHFNKDQIPPVNAFWSITMYSLPESQLIENEIHRYNIGGYTPGLKTNADGSIDIFIQNDRPNNISNWLPAPENDFWIVLRMYVPKKEVLEKKYITPEVIKQ